MRANYPDDPALQLQLKREEERFQLADALRAKEELVEALEEELAEAYDRYERCYAEDDLQGAATAAKDIELLETEIDERMQEVC